jgi:hypothetical protein
VATGIWYVVTSLFVRIEAFTGKCKHWMYPEAPRHVCLQSGQEWQEGHDISGHTFLLLYALLIIDEEVIVYEKISQKVDRNHTKMLSMMIKALYVAL